MINDQCSKEDILYLQFTFTIYSQCSMFFLLLFMLYSVYFLFCILSIFYLYSQFSSQCCLFCSVLYSVNVVFCICKLQSVVCIVTNSSLSLANSIVITRSLYGNYQSSHRLVTRISGRLAARLAGRLAVRLALAGRLAYQAGW